MTGIEKQETRRLALQAELDARKNKNERNRLGQFATPTALAREILAFGRQLLGPRRKIHFLDPAIGTGSFYSALRSVAPASKIGRCVGFDIDPHYAEPARALWKNTTLDLRTSDFTTAEVPGSTPEQANLVICNPPYVRHHHLDGDRKRELQATVYHRLGIRPSGLSGLYCHFMWLSHAWMAPGGVAGWLIPGEWMDVNYGTLVKQYLLGHVDLVRIHRFDPSNVQFDDALVSSVVVWFRNQAPGDQPVEFSYGGTLAEPGRLVPVPRQTLRATRKWTRILASPQPSVTAPTTSMSATDTEGPILGDLFRIKRGVATGANGFFVLTREAIEEHQLPWRFLRPILPSPRYLESDEITADSSGDPLIERRRYLLAVDQPEHVVEAEYPSLWAYLQQGIDAGIHERYLSRHRRPWYAQEHRPPAPILCTYMGRTSGRDDRPFRFILNRSQATAANVYLMLYARPALTRAAEREPDLLRTVWRGLNRVPVSTLLGEGRVYGGGLHKLEPRELGNLPLATLGVQLPERAIERRHRNPGWLAGV